MNKLGEIIKEYRWANDMTRKALAGKIGISASSLKNYETGRVNPNVYTVNAIANAMGMQGWKLVKEMLKEE